MSKNIWIINEYAGSPYHGMEYRHYYLGKEFVKLGYSVNVVSSSYSHLFYNLPENSKENIDGLNYLWLKTLNYRDSHNKKRVLKWFIFSLKILLLPFKLNKPDVIILSPMASFPFVPAWFLAKFYRCKLIYEVKDIWPLSLLELGGFSANHPLILLMSWVEKLAIKKSDVIVSNLPNYGEYLKDSSIDKEFIWISNGFALDEIKKVEDLPFSITNKIPKNKFIVGYVGTVGAANTLDSFLDSYSYIDNENICYVVVGGGKEKNRLAEKYCSKSVVFIDPIHKDQVQSMLRLFDICFLGWQKKSLYKYGTSANKIFDYMFSGRPIINAYSGKADLVEIANCGICVEAQDSNSIAISVLKLYNMSKNERNALGANGKNYALKNFSYEKLAAKYIHLL